MKCLLFKKRFAAAVRNGQKRQTIRKPRIRPIMKGDRLSLRTWEGLPRRSKHIILGDHVCKNVLPVTITAAGINKNIFYVYVNDKLLNDAQVERFAKADGFESGGEFIKFFDSVHGLPFRGDVITW